MRKVTFSVPALLAAALLLGACGSDDTMKSTSEGAAPAAPRQLSTGNAEDDAGRKARQPGQNQADQKIRLQATARQIVYTADLRVRAKKVDDAADKARQFVTSAGGHVGNETTHATPGSPASANITFKIPANKYSTVLRQLTTELGTKLSLNQQAEDVTEEVADVNSRVKSATATLASFRKLLGQAKTVGEVIKVEEEIARREADLESLQARQKSLSQQTTYGTVTLRLEGPEAPKKDEDDDAGGFIGGLESGWNALVAIAVGIATVFGWLLPFLVVALVIAVLAKRFWPALRRLVPRARIPRPADSATGQPPDVKN